MRYIRLVREFNEALDPDSALKLPGLPKPGKRLLRVQLMFEELAEVTEALCSGDLYNVLSEMLDLQYVIDGAFCVYGSDMGIRMDDWKTECAGPPRLPQTEDAQLMFITSLGKMISEVSGCMIGGNDYQVVGSAVFQARSALFSLWNAMAVPEDLRWDLFQALHAANMAKLGGGVNEAGRVQKPEGWQRADLRAVLARHGLMIPEGSNCALPITNFGEKPC